MTPFWKPRAYAAVFLLGTAFWTGCVGTAPVRPPIETPPIPPPPPPAVTPQTHLEGTWENGSHQPPRQLIFGADGSVTFRGGLEFFGVGRWELDTDRQELRITLDQAPNDKLQIFQMDVGDGVKAFSPAQKQITYHFDMQTYTLDIAGWPYSKEEQVAPTPKEVEPVLQ